MTGSTERGGFAHVLAVVRSAIYAVVAPVFFVAVSLIAAPTLLLPADRVRWTLIFWSGANLTLLRWIVGQRVCVLGRENIPTGPALVAAKHQAAWETMALIPLLPRCVVILKKELRKIPLYGYYAQFYGMIFVDRAAGPSALKQLAVDASRAMEKSEQLVIFPEGTRQAIGAAPDYKPGAVFLYEKLKVPMVPVALNSGVLWPRGSFVRYPGTVTIAFLPPIPPGLPRAEARAALEAAIETETARLVALDGRPPPEGC